MNQTTLHINHYLVVIFKVFYPVFLKVFPQFVHVYEPPVEKLMLPQYGQTFGRLVTRVSEFLSFFPLLVPYWTSIRITYVRVLRIPAFVLQLILGLTSRAMKTMIIIMIAP